MTETKNAQEWLKNKYKKEGQKFEAVVFEEIKMNDDNEEEKVTKLEGEMAINGENNPSLVNIKKINLYGAEGITKLTIEGCPNVTELDVYGNKELTEIVGLEKLSKLAKLSCGKTKINKIDVSKNNELKELYFPENTQTKIIGFRNVVKNLVTWGSINGIPFPWEQILEEDLKEIAEALDIEKGEIEGKPVDKIKETVKQKAEQLRKNEKEIKEKFPDLINGTGEIVGKKLDELKNLNENKEDVAKKIKRLELENKVLKREVEIIKGKERVEELLAQIEVPVNEVH
jgi:Leucine-rich repeat (LRR) protein